MMSGQFGKLLGLLPLLVVAAVGQDTVGVKDGYYTLSTTNFDIKIVKDSQVLASLKPKGQSFDFLPFDFISMRDGNNQYHLGDVTYRYRTVGTTAWTSGDSSLARKAVTNTTTSALLASVMGPTLGSATGLTITREWINVSGDLGLQFTIKNPGTSAVEVGSLGFPTEFNSIFSDRTAAAIQSVCSLEDPYIGLNAGYLRVTPVSGVGPALVVTPLGNTSFEAYRNLNEPSTDPLYYGSQTFEGLYEWQVFTKAWAQNEWSSAQPWNTATSLTLAAGASATFGLRFSVSLSGVRGIEATVKGTGTPLAIGIPGYIIPQDLPAKLFLFSSASVTGMTTDPANAFTIKTVNATSYELTPSTSAWGRVKLTITYSDGKLQTVHYYIIKSAPTAISDLGNFFTTSAWYTDTSDPFGRAPSVMTYDYQAKKIVLQDSRVWVAGLSDEGGVGAYLATVVKQAAQPNANEVTKLESFINTVVWGRIQTSDFAVRKSIFYYDPSLVPGYTYSSSLDWTSWESWSKANAYLTDRAYDYVHVAAAYWAMYRVGRAYPSLLKTRTWDWYLTQAYSTIIRCMQSDVGYNDDGLMGETVFGQILTDLTREGYTSQASSLTTAMRTRAAAWNNEAVPFGSEMAWDSTGQEGIYYWSKYFSYTSTTAKALNSVLGYTPTVAHWGWNGNARRYWDNLYGGKLERIERQIHHYGSALNSQVLLSGFQSNVSDTYLIRVGYGGMNGPLSSITQDGFAAASFHSWPDTLAWDGISGDYGPGFLGMVLSAATHVVQDPDVGLVAYGGILTAGDTVTVQPRDAVRRKIHIAPLGVTISIDAGIIQQFTYQQSSKSITVTLSQLSTAPQATAAVMWVETTSGSTTYSVTTSGLSKVRSGWQIPLTSGAVTVQIAPA